jgi:hypothetical protein
MKKGEFMMYSVMNWMMRTGRQPIFFLNMLIISTQYMNL